MYLWSIFQIYNFRLCALKKIEVDDRRKSRTKEAIQKEAKYVLQKGYLEKSCTCMCLLGTITKMSFLRAYLIQYSYRRG